jgi:hypothetical protein
MLTIESMIKKVCRNNMILFGILGVYIGFLSIFIVGMVIKEGNWVMIVPALIFWALTFLIWFFFIKAARIRRNIKLDGGIKKLVKSGPGSADEIIARIDAELANSLRFSNKDKFFITQNWVIARAVFSFSFRPLNELIWVYKQITNTNYGAKWYRIVLIFSDRKKVEAATGPEKEIDTIIAFISKNVGHVLVGYSSVYKGMFNANFNQFIDLGKKQAQDRQARQAQQPGDGNVGEISAGSQGLANP